MQFPALLHSCDGVANAMYSKLSLSDPVAYVTSRKCQLHSFRFGYETLPVSRPGRGERIQTVVIPALTGQVAS